MRPIEPMHDEHVNVTPLIDVVMCLIIFFMICGKLVKNEIEGKVEVPEARLGQEMAEQREKLVINLVPNEEELAKAQDASLSTPERLHLAAGTIHPKWKVGTRAVTTEDELKGLLKDAVKANKDIKVTIRADQVQQYLYISPILVACARANIKTVNFSTKRMPGE